MEQENGSENKQKGMTPRKMVSFMVNTCFARIKTLDFERAESFRKPFKQMLTNEKKSYPGQDEKYDKLIELVDNFFEYIHEPEIMDLIKNDKLTRDKLEELVLTNVAHLPKRKYDMRDLYRRDLIAVSSNNPNIRKSSVAKTDNGPTYEYTDSNNRKVLITDVGQIGYEEWSGIHARLSLYLIQKQQEDGHYSGNLVCSSIAISDMDKPEYREAVLGELLSDENIHNAKVGPYIGRITREHKQDDKDLPHTERQDANGYTYRINSEYVLEYDATELSAVVEAVRNSNNRRKNMPSDALDKKVDSLEDKKGKNEHGEHDEI